MPTEVSDASSENPKGAAAAPRRPSYVRRNSLRHPSASRPISVTELSMEDSDKGSRSKSGFASAEQRDYAALTPGLNVKNGCNDGKPAMCKYTLSFVDPGLEAEYEDDFLRKHFAIWRSALACLLMLSTAWFGYKFYANQYEAQNYASKVSLRQPGTSVATSCPPGYYCAACNPFSLCGDYNIMWDVAFYIGGVVVPIMTCFAAAMYFSRRTMAKYMHHLSTFLTVTMGVVAIIVRYSVMEVNHDVYEPGILLMIFVNAVYVFLRARHIHVLASAAILEVLHFVVLAIHLYTAESADSDGLMAHIENFWTLSAAMLITMGTAWFSCWENEFFYRAQFLAAHQLRTRNAKLINQLRTLQNDLGKKAANFESPLEKSLMLLRSLVADSSITAAQIATLSQVLQFLGSSNLQTPDMENQESKFADNEQEEWLFSEIAQRKRNVRSSRSTNPNVSVRGRRGTITITDELKRKIGESIPESADTSILHPSSRGSTVDHAPTQSTHTATSGPHLPGESAVAANGTRSTQAMVTTTKSEKSFAQIVPHGSSRASIRTSPSLRVHDLKGLLWDDDVTGMLQRCIDFNFPLFDFQRATGDNPMQVMAQHLFEDCGFFDHFSLPRDKFKNFAAAIEAGYRADLPYHNSTHATDVLHCMYYLSSQESVSKLTTELDLMAMLVAAMVHDFEHPGLNNNFLINTADARAILYNDKSVLENHHAAASFAILGRAECNFLEPLSKADYKLFREIVIDMVLATDLSQHLTLVSMFKNKLSTLNDFSPYEKKEDRLLLYKILMKCSDVCNPTKDWPLYETWCRRILDEWYMQGDCEKRLGLSVSPFMDRDNVNVPSSQTGFIDFVVTPLFEAYDKYAPVPLLMGTLQRNREHWQALKAQNIMLLKDIVAPDASTAVPRVQPKTPPPGMPAGRANKSQSRYTLQEDEPKPATATTTPPNMVVRSMLVPLHEPVPAMPSPAPVRPASSSVTHPGQKTSATGKAMASLSDKLRLHKVNSTPHIVNYPSSSYVLASQPVTRKDGKSILSLGRNATASKTEFSLDMKPFAAVRSGSLGALPENSNHGA
ncbi:hypothetical protein SeLEV6574_g01087 [Synchytrium endobioticum]|uniref:Phosphodiesterase n=1 Tax=Synchytrium endobioticum TaxID=286115 RepID=A0A507DFU9_9FUNG|nr:hypothetical protein SeLEV6574_g01087 [Synchytrium endobioticum]